MKDWLVLNPYPPDDWMKHVAAITSDARESPPDSLRDILGLYDTQFNNSSDSRFRGPIYWLGACLGRDSFALPVGRVPDVFLGVNVAIRLIMIEVRGPTCELSKVV